jgi:hypothetical protein
MNIDLRQLESFLSSFAFRGNNKLRPAGTSIEYTSEMVAELIRCKNDPIYFIKKYIMVIHVDKGLVPLSLFPYQEKLIEAYHANRKVITKQPRQYGKTVTTAAYVLHYLLFNDEKTVAILANKALIAREILSRIQIMYENLPKWLQQGVVSWNKGSIELENKSRVIAQATSSSAVRGMSLSLLVLDEFAFLENNIAEDFFTSVFPTLSSGKETKLLISSTPKGFNHYWKFWNDAEKGLNGFVPYCVHWYDHPERDQKWYEEQLAVLGEMKFNQEVNCLSGESKVTLRNKQTGKIIEMTLENLYEQI